MSKKVDTWMPLLVDKYLGDTQHLTTEQHGAYLLLLMAMWKREGVLPNDDQQLATIARLPAARWRASRAVLMDFFRPTEDGAGLTQKRLAAELVRATAANEKKSKAGAKGAQKRWYEHGTKDGKQDGTPDGKSDGTAIADALPEQWLDGAPIPTPSATQIQETASAVSARASVGQALKRAGVDVMRINLDDPRLTALVEQGATPAEFEGIGREAVERGIASPIGWICAALTGRRAQAAAAVLAPRQDTADAGAIAVAETAAFLAEQQQRAEQAQTPEAREARRAAMARVGRAA